MVQYRVTTVHGESDTIWHIVDTEAPEEDQPSIYVSLRAKCWLEILRC